MNIKLWVWLYAKEKYYLDVLKVFKRLIKVKGISFQSGIINQKIFTNI